MKKIYRIKKTSEIDAIFKTRKRVQGKYFNIFYQPNNQTFRFAISIGKKYGNAVERNLMKRRIREVINYYKENLDSFDFVVVVKKESANLSFQQIKEELTKLLYKSEIMEETR